MRFPKGMASITKASSREILEVRSDWLVMSEM